MIGMSIILNLIYDNINITETLRRKSIITC